MHHNLSWQLLLLSNLTLPMRHGLSLSGGQFGPVHAQGAGLAHLEHAGSRVLQAAQNQAIHTFAPPEIMDTDQDSQSTSFTRTDRLRQSGVRISMDGKGVRKLTLDTIFIERLWRSLKYECVDLHAWETGSETKAAIRKWMTFYNHQRPHSALGGKPPALVYWQRNDINQPDQQVQRVA